MPRKKQVRAKSERGEPTFIREWRKFRGLTQEQLAELTHMSTGNLSAIETDQTDYTKTTLERLARALNTRPADLISRDPNNSEDIIEIWRLADPQQRAMLLEIAKTVVNVSVRKHDDNRN